MSFPLKLMKNNYHTHMYLCRHAIGSVEDYVEKAIELGFTSLGMSDHAPFESLKDRSIRMHQSDYPLYLDMCNQAIHKYRNDIKVYKALEIEYFPEHDMMYRCYLNELDYLALGQHYIKDVTQPNQLRSTYRLTTHEHIQTYVDTLIEAIDTRYFAFICHPDLMLFNIDAFDDFIYHESERLIIKAKESRMPLEINVNGIRKGMRMTPAGNRYLYPRREFWEIVKKHQPRVIISSDAHEPSSLYDSEVEIAYRFAASLGIKVEEALDFSNTV